MNCKKCNSEITNDDLYCPYCGEKILKEEDSNNGFDVVSKIGMIFGIITVATCIIPLVSIFFCIHSVILCIIGSRSKKRKSKINRKIGLLLAFAAPILLFTLYITLLVTFTIVELIMILFV